MGQVDTRYGVSQKGSDWMMKISFAQKMRTARRQLEDAYLAEGLEAALPLSRRMDALVCCAQRVRLGRIGRPPRAGRSHRVI